MIKQLIQKGILTDAMVLLLLIGPNTKCREHVDCEINGALDLIVGDHYAGLLGLILLNHPDYGKKNHTKNLIP